MENQKIHQFADESNVHTGISSIYLNFIFPLYIMIYSYIVIEGLFSRNNAILIFNLIINQESKRSYHLSIQNLSPYEMVCISINKYTVFGLSN